MSAARRPDAFYDTEMCEFISYHVVYSLETDELLTTASSIPLTVGRYYPVFSYNAGHTVYCLYIGTL